MSNLLKNKKLLGALLLVIIAVLGYQFVLKSDTVVPGGAFLPVTGEPVGQDLIQLSEALSKVTLSPAVFNTPSFRSLEDLTLPLPSQPLGRKNPFDIIGRD